MPVNSSIFSNLGAIYSPVGAGSAVKVTAAGVPGDEGDDGVLGGFPNGLGVGVHGVLGGAEPAGEGGRGLCLGGVLPASGDWGLVEGG